jgi:hypothetical protein
MYYHTVVLHLFRPFLKVDLLGSEVSPREICARSAESVSSLVARYRDYYGFRRVCVILTHIILSSCTVHLLNLPTPSATHSLAEGIRALREMSINSGFAGRCLQIIISLSKKWGISLPSEVQEAAAAISPDTIFSTPSSEEFFAPLQQSEPNRHQRRHSATELLMPVPATSNNTSKGTLAPSAAAGNPSDLFWTPFPDHSMPLQVNPESGPMDITAMLDVRLNDWEQFNRDGFKMATVADPILGQPIYFDDWAQV